MLGYDVEALCAAGPAQILARTDVTQPALLAVSVGIYRILRREGLRYDVALGHSLGEYSALVATGRVRPWRGAPRSCGGAARRCSPPPQPRRAAWPPFSGSTTPQSSALRRHDGVWPANYNSPGQVVVSGTHAASSALAARPRPPGAKKVIPLAVSGAFHTPLDRGGRRRRCAPSSRRSTGASQTRRSSRRRACVSRAVTSSALLQRQLVSPVRFAPAVSALNAAGYDAFLEIGPGSVLSGLVRRIAPQAAVVARLRRRGRSPP